MVHSAIYTPENEERLISEQLLLQLNPDSQSMK